MSIKDVLKYRKLDHSFLDQLDDFTLSFVGDYFLKRSQGRGLNMRMSKIELYNYNLYMDYLRMLDEQYGEYDDYDDVA